MKKFSELRNEMNGSTASIRNTSRKLASLRLSDKCSANFNKPRGSSFAMQIYRVSQNKIGQVCKYLYEICLIAKKVY